MKPLLYDFLRIFVPGEKFLLFAQFLKCRIKEETLLKKKNEKKSRRKIEGRINEVLLCRQSPNLHDKTSVIFSNVLTSIYLS